MPSRSPVPVVALGVTLIALAGCSGDVTSPTSAPSPITSTGDSVEGDGHGEISGAAEVAEPPLGLLSIDRGGEVGLLDLLDATESRLGSIGAPEALAGDGRFAFVTTADGLDIVDSGRWSWDHGDHFHYYLAEPRIVGSVTGDGPVTVATGMLSTEGSTGVFFQGSGEAVLLDNAALGEGEVVETFRVSTGSDGAVVAPLHDGALIAAGDSVTFHEASGDATGHAADCADAAGTITTRVGVVVGCADGAVLVTWQDSAPVFEHIPYPESADAARATTFDGRKGRPSVAAPAGSAGLWLLDTRDRSWAFLPAEAPLVRAVAVDDEEGHVVALDDAGRVRIFAAESGEQVGVTEPLVAEADSAVSLTVDGQRAYLADPATDSVLEIDYADGGRVARTLTTPTAPYVVTEVGR